MKRLYVWDGDDVCEGGVMFSLAESVEDAREDIVLAVVGSTLPRAVAEYDLDFLESCPSVYSQAEVVLEAT